MIIWIASYPRSGNTFLRVVLKNAFDLETYSIYNDLRVIGANDSLAKAVGHKPLPADFNIEAARASDDLYVIKTHEYPSDKNDKAIYLIRDGRESSVSYWHYLQNFGGDSFSLDDVLYGSVPFGLWGDHVEQWDPLNRPNLLTLKFEDLTSDPEALIPSVSAFVGVREKSFELPSFDKLQQHNPLFFRKGAADSWKLELSEQQEYIFWLLNFQRMAEFYPEETMPADLNKTEVSKTHSVVLEQGKLLRTRNRELRQNLLENDNQLNQLRNSVGEIRNIAAELVEAKALRSPQRKFKNYKRLIETIFTNVPEKHDDE